MKLKAVVVAGLLGLTFVASPSLAVDSKSLSLVDAAMRGDEDAVRALLSAGTKADAVSTDGTSALMWAVSRNDFTLAQRLLAAGADAKAVNDYGATALYVAASNADAAMAAKLLEAGASPNAPLISGETPLMEAARRGKLDMVRLLLMHGANPNAKESNGGQTALMWAVSERHATLTEELVRHGTDIHARSRGGFTALMFAAQQGDAESAGILLEAGANPNEAAPKSGLTPLIIASAMAHADCFATMDRCALPAIVANSAGHTAVAAMLLDKGSDPDAADATGFTALHHAARDKKALPIVMTLLAHGAHPDVRLHQEQPMALASGVLLQGATPLAIAAEINNLEAVKALVAGGADPLIGTAQGTTPLILAAGGGTDLARPRSVEERATAIETVKFLVDHGADVNWAGQFGWTALHAAAYQGLNDVIAYLASKGAKLDAMDGFGQTPLSISYAIITKDIRDAYYQSPRVFRRDTANLLLSLGATPLEKSGVVAAVLRKE
jgi:ankyrin repeat protein